MTINDDIRAALDALARISLDPNETPARQLKAKQALDLHTNSLPESTSSFIGHPMKLNRGHSGGDSMRTDSVYEGWGENG